MTTSLPAPRTESYQLSDRMIDDTPVPAAFHTPAPNEAAREELLLKKLGARGWGRLHHFRQFYQPGWGERRCRPLSPRATEAFFRFLEEVRFASGCMPSLFLTDQGGLELRWELNGRDVQVEFSSEGIESYSAADGNEAVVPHAEASAVARRFSAV